MTSTQAQIEAAAKCFYEMYERDQYQWDRLPREVIQEYLDAATAALAAAAEVGGQKPTLEQIARTAEVITRAKQDIIERCAQVVKKNPRYFLPEEHAATIRALQERP